MMKDSFLDEINRLSVNNYKLAFSALEIKDVHIRILEAHYKSIDHDITASELARVLNFESLSVSNLRYGRLAGNLCRFFQIAPPIHLHVLVDFEERRGETHWIMHSKVVQALHELHWFD